MPSTRRSTTRRSSTLSASTEKETLLLKQIASTEEWAGWCTVESEPAVFNQLLWDIGVSQAQIHEIYSLDLESFDAIKPIYGLIFLFQWKKEPNEEEVEISCPEGLWFANQVIDNSCASLALLNIVLNVPDLDIGEHLAQFKEFTKEFSPSLRGLALTNFSFLRNLHNSLSRASERAALDIALMDAAKSKQRGKGDSSDEDESFHFIAYVPLNGVLWELDGLRRQPVRLGNCEDGKWLHIATPRIQERIERYSTEEIRFSLLALAQRRLPLLASQLEDLTQLSTTLQSQLNTLVPDWAALETFVAAADTKVDPVIVSQALEKGDPQTILSVKKALERDIAILRANLADEEEKISEYTEYVMRRRNDYTAFIRCMLEKLAQQDLIRPILS